MVCYSLCCEKIILLNIKISVKKIHIWFLIVSYFDKRIPGNKQEKCIAGKMYSHAIEQYPKAALAHWPFGQLGVFIYL